MARCGVLIAMSFVAVALFPNGVLGEDYVIGMVESFSVDALFGTTWGWIQLETQSRQGFGSYSKMNFLVPDFIENKTFVVHTSDTDHNVYAFHNHMQFSPLPIHALGTKYIVSSCRPPGNYTSVLVIASHSQKTDVDITIRTEGNVTYENITYSDGETLSFNLKEHQTVGFKSDFDLSGSIINSSETVAVFSGTYHSNTNQVVAYDQLLPVKHHGKEYVVAVDNHPAQYKLLIVSEDRDTKIGFSDGHTVSVDEKTSYRQTLNPNDLLFFNATKPVMATLCREKDILSGFVIIPPVSSYRKRSNVFLLKNEKMIILKEKINFDVEVRSSPITNISISWQDIPGTRFQVGTYRAVEELSYYISSGDGRFTVLILRPAYIYNGGYNFLTPSPPSTAPSVPHTTSKPDTATPSEPNNMESQCVQMTVLLIVGGVSGSVILVLVVIIVLLIRGRKVTKVATRNPNATDNVHKGESSMYDDFDIENDYDQISKTDHSHQYASMNKNEEESVF